MHGRRIARSCAGGPHRCFALRVFFSQRFASAAFICQQALSLRRWDACFDTRAKRDGQGRVATALINDYACPMACEFESALSTSPGPESSLALVSYSTLARFCRAAAETPAAQRRRSKSRRERYKSLAYDVELALHPCKCCEPSSRACHTNLSDRRSAAPRGAETQRGAVDAAPINPPPRRRDVKT